MLFIFESNDYWTFHMKNTFIPLDIAFIKEDGTIDSIKELDPMNPVPVYPDSEVRYAVEVNRGWFAENDVNVGDALLEEAEELNEVKDKKGKGSGTKDACYYKVKSRYSVWPSAYASGALVKCRKVGAANWGNSRKEEVEYEVNEMVGKVANTAKKIGSVVQGKTETSSKDFRTREITKEIMKDRKPIMKDRKPQPAPPAPMADHYNWRQELDEKCWPGYEKKGMKTMFGKRYPNCVKKSKKKK
jgi:hypothetical protein